MRRVHKLLMDCSDYIPRVLLSFARGDLLYNRKFKRPPEAEPPDGRQERNVRE